MSFLVFKQMDQRLEYAKQVSDADYFQTLL